MKVQHALPGKSRPPKWLGPMTLLAVIEMQGTSQDYKICM